MDFTVTDSSHPEFISIPPNLPSEILTLRVTLSFDCRCGVATLTSLITVVVSGLSTSVSPRVT